MSEEKTSKKSQTKNAGALKRVEAVIRAEKTNEVIAALKKIDCPATFYDSKGIGTGEKFSIRYGRGAGLAPMVYSDRRTVTTIVAENKVDQVVSIIKETAKVNKTGGAGGIIVISSVDDLQTI